MSKIHDFSGGIFCHMQLNVKLLRLSITINFTKDEDNISQLGDDDAPFCEQQYTRGSCYISLFKFKSFDQLIPPNCLKFYTFTQLWHYSDVLDRIALKAKLYVVWF